MKGHQVPPLLPSAQPLSTHAFVGVQLLRLPTRHSTFASPWWPAPVLGPARCPRAHWQRAKLACPQSMQDLSNSLSTEYLRRKILFFFKKKRERERGGGHKGRGGKEGERNLPHHCSQGHKHGCGAGAGKEPLIQELRPWKLNACSQSTLLP